MINLSVQEVEKVISESPVENGSFNLFFKINDKIGLKLCSTKNIRDKNYKRQTEAAKFELGPETYGIIDKVQYQGFTFWGYFTEIVEVFEGHNDFVSKYCTEDRIKLKKELAETIDFNFTDFHYGNVGHKNGKLVCIDFDYFPEEETEENTYQRIDIEIELGLLD